ncbi:MAG: hypothetical protein ACLF0G_18105 [Candidatus Brocadiia bacterium]
MSTSQGKGQEKAEGPGATPEALVWFFLVVAVMATLYFLMHEPEDGSAADLPSRLRQARVVALAASVFGAVPGVWQVVCWGGRQNLFALGVLTNVVLACFWILRVALGV